MEFTEAELKSLWGVKEVSKATGLTQGKVRRMANKGQIPGFFKLLGVMAFKSEELENWEPPVTVSRRGGGARRKADDGTPKFRYLIWATDAEVEALNEAGFETSDPRKGAAERRAAKRAAEAVGEKVSDEEADPFAGLED